MSVPEDFKKGDRVHCGGYGFGTVSSVRYFIVYVLFDGDKKSTGVHYSILNSSRLVDGVK